MDFQLIILDWRNLMLLAGATILIAFLVGKLVGGMLQRRVFYAFAVFYFLYNGFGVGYLSGVAEELPTKYMVFLSSLGVAYAVFLKIFLAPSKHVRHRLMPYLKAIISNRTLIYVILVAYCGTFLFDLLYPEFKLDRIVLPPAPRVADQFREGLEVKITGNFDTLTKLADNFEYLIYPFYLLALYRFRHKPGWLLAALLIPQYLYYCSLGYINRARFLESLFMYGAILWIFNKHWRRRLLIAGFVLLPVIPISLIQYAYVRSEEEVLQVGPVDATEMIIYSETIMPTFSKRIYSTRKRINKKRYFIWMLTLPIPKVIIGAVPNVTAGGEMSEILLGRKRGEQGYYALLAGLLNESVYIYGDRLYFLHALMLGMILAFAIRLVEYNAFLVPVQLILIVLICYALNRAGIGSLVSQLLNKFMTLYLFIAVIYAVRLGILPVVDKRIANA